MVEQTFVFEGVEVRKTGRTAVRTVTVAGGKSRELILIEITPVDDSDWKKWVSPEHLYVIREGNNK